MVNNSKDNELLNSLIKTNINLNKQLETLVRYYNLSLSEFGILKSVYSLGPKSIQTLAKLILITSGSMTYVINRLLKKDLVFKERSEEDNRVFVIYLTKKGENLIKELIIEYDKLINSFFKVLSKKEKKNLTNSLIKLY